MDNSSSTNNTCWRDSTRTTGSFINSSPITQTFFLQNAEPGLSSKMQERQPINYRRNRSFPKAYRGDGDVDRALKLFQTTDRNDSGDEAIGVAVTSEGATVVEMSSRSQQPLRSGGFMEEIHSGLAEKQAIGDEEEPVLEMTSLPSPGKNKGPKDSWIDGAEAEEIPKEEDMNAGFSEEPEDSWEHELGV